MKTFVREQPLQRGPVRRKYSCHWREAGVEAMARLVEVHDIHDMLARRLCEGAGAVSIEYAGGNVGLLCC